MSDLWDFTAKTKADFSVRNVAVAPRETRGEAIFEKVSFGREIIHFARTFFERNL